MKLEEKVTNLEFSKRLKELGVKQESCYFWWVSDGIKIDHRLLYRVDMKAQHPNEFSAFTVAEIGEKLGRATEENLMLAYGKVFNVPETRFVTAMGLQACMSRPDLGAKMLIYLIENKLVILK